MSSLPDFEVIGTANDGIEALKAIETLLPDVVILDIIMPQLDGLTVLEKLKKMKLNRIPKVIILSAIWT